jgi:hypothetical protein
MTRPIHRAALGMAFLLAIAAPASRALAWGATGHRLIGRLGVAALPANLPAFLRTPEAVETIGEYAREPDRWKGTGEPHDSERNAAHFTDVDDSGKILGGPALDALPPTRAKFEEALQKVGSNSYVAGYLPYSIIDGWQQLGKDFAYWRVLTAAIANETDPVRRAWLQRDLARREALTLRDLGVWAHYVGDGSQPMHVSVHFNGWGAYPNPNNYTQQKVHAPFEGAFVRANVSADDVSAAMTPSSPCTDAIDVCTSRYLAQTEASVLPFYELEKAGAFRGVDTAKGKAYAAGRIAAAASEVRDLVITAWAASANGTVGYPPLSVDQVVKDKLDPYDALYGED